MSDDIWGVVILIKNLLVIVMVKGYVGSSTKIREFFDWIKKYKPNLMGIKNFNKRKQNHISSQLIK